MMIDYLLIGLGITNFLIGSYTKEFIFIVGASGMILAGALYNGIKIPTKR